MTLRLVLPDGWVSIPLEDPAARAQAVDAVVARARFDDGDGARLRRELRDHLVGAAADAAGAGAASMVLSTGDGRGVSIPASIIATFLPFADRPDVEEPWLAESGGRLDTATVAAGPVVRRVSQRSAPMEGVEIPTLVVDYWLTAPDWGLAHLAMSTPLVAHEEAMVGLFDAIVESASWADAEPTR